MFPGALSDNTSKALAILGHKDILNKAYLAGGTALALQLGHRMSIDLDFFSSTEFDSQKIVETISSIGTHIGDEQTPKTINGIFEQVKFSYFYYQYPLIENTTEFEGIKLAGPQDIAAMRLVAITDRGTKKDYIDLYFLTKQYSFEEMFEFYDKKYQLIEQNRFIIMKSLTYFLDADESPIPIMIQPVEWEEVKHVLQQEVKKLAATYL